MIKNYILYIFCFLTTSVVNGQNYDRLLQDLPYLHYNQLSGQDDSHDPKGRNRDGIDNGNFLYEQANAVSGDLTREFVLCEVNSPGIIDRMWMTWIDSTAHLRFYFNGATTPDIDKPFYAYFQQPSEPYSSPLSFEFTSNSGGYISYLPIPFSQSVKITLTQDSTAFYHIGYRKFLPDTIIKDFSENTDVGALETYFTPTGINPKDNSDYTLSAGEIIGLEKSEQIKIADISGKKSIEEIKINFPELDFSYDSKIITDDGRAYKGRTKFTMNIDPNADTVYLIKRWYYPAGVQRVKIFADDSLVAFWTLNGLEKIEKFAESPIRIPKRLTQGKTSIEIRSTYDEGNASNEFYYWTYCDGVYTDSLDVGNTTDEEAHNYSITEKIWYRTYSIGIITPDFIRQKNEDILKNTFIKIFWNNQPNPSVNCPVGAFFGLGTMDAVEVKMIPTGVDDQKNLYAFWSMPFEQNCKIYLENKGNATLHGIRYVISSDVFNNDFTSVGYFHSFYRDTLTQDSIDFNFADIQGWGKYVGITLEGRNPEKYWWLEGDERFYLDDNKTPQIHGTGTEDYFNGGFYFYTGPFNKPVHGLSAQFYEDRAMYRYHITDPISFLHHGVFGLEHGEFNNWDVNYVATTFFYLKDTAQTILTDSIDFASETQVANHQVRYNGTPSLLSGSFEGDNDNILFSFLDYITTDSIQFNLKILPGNDGVRLQRIFDYSILNQAFDVYVDDLKVGTWYSGGKNPFVKLREEYYMIPSTFTKDKEQINIKLINIGAAPFSLAKIKTYIIKGKSSLPTGLHQQLTTNITAMPNPAHNQIILKDSEGIHWELHISNSNGQKVLEQSNYISGSPIDISTLSPGTYFISGIQENGNRYVQKFIKE